MEADRLADGQARGSSHGQRTALDLWIVKSRKNGRLFRGIRARWANQYSASLRDRIVRDERKRTTDEIAAMSGAPNSWIQTELGLTFHWDIRKLWDADLPVVPIRVQELEWLLEKPFWKDDQKQLTVRPRDVEQNPERNPAHYDRAMAAYLSWPINVIFLRGRWVIMDGLHRLLKASLHGHTTIMAKQAHEQDIPLFRRNANDPSNHP